VQLRHVSPILNRLVAHYELFNSILFHHVSQNLYVAFTSPQCGEVNDGLFFQTKVQV
jgi:hypothetical protein